MKKIFFLLIISSLFAHAKAMDPFDNSKKKELRQKLRYLQSIIITQKDNNNVLKEIKHLAINAQNCGFKSIATKAYSIHKRKRNQKEKNQKKHRKIIFEDLMDIEE
ncbi:MAG: hypothetical protein WDZ41_01855 [Candidatus Babeliales bacterium]